MIANEEIESGLEAPEVYWVELTMYLADKPFGTDVPADKIVYEDVETEPY